jgi:hypothetical protein
MNVNAKFTTNTISINYNVYGTGIPVLEHLLILTISIVRLAGLKLQSRFQVIGIDFRGYGRVTKAMIQILRHDKLSK